MKVRFEKEKLSDILVNFYNLTNMRFVIFDEDFNRILAYPEESSDFCTMLKSYPETKAKCRLNDKEACKFCKKTNKLHIYKCHAGLIEVVAPIKMNGINLGYIMFGQICEKGADKSVIKDYAKSCFPCEEDLEDAVKKISSKSDEQIMAAAKIMEICTCYLCIYDIIKIDSENLIFHLSNYIDSNLSTNELSVEELCSFFKLSRSKLYEISHKYYGMSIAKYIRKKRIEVAKNYLNTKKCSIAKAAEKSGFFDANYFSKVFKAEEGMSPGEYKKSVTSSDSRLNALARHYDILIDENNDPVHDPKPLRDYMDKWDGQTFIDKLQLDKTKSVLEIGVGTGRLAVRVAPLCLRFTGIDLSLKTISRAKQNLENFKNTDLVCGDFFTINFNTTFDVIYSSLTFMHIKEKQNAINKVFTLLNDNGVFALSIDKNQDNVIDIGTSQITAFPDDPKEIEKYIKNAGMTVTEQYQTEFAHIFIAKKGM